LAMLIFFNGLPVKAASSRITSRLIPHNIRNSPR
jgi:hypothetical protein